MRITLFLLVRHLQVLSIFFDRYPLMLTEKLLNFHFILIFFLSLFLSLLSSSSPISFPCYLFFNPPKRKFSVAHAHLPFHSAEQVTSVHSHSSGRMSSLLSLAEGKQPIHVLPPIFYYSFRCRGTTRPNSAPDSS